MLHLFYTITYDKIRYFIYIFYLKTDHGNLTDLNKKSLKIPKGQSEFVYRRTDWPKEKLQKVKQQSTKHTHKTEDRVK